MGAPIGENALVGDAVIGPMWARTAFSPSDAATYLVAEGGLAAGDGASLNAEAIAGAAKIAQFCAEDLSETAEVIWGWDEFSEGHPNRAALDEFALPDEWRRAEPPVPGTTWAAWLWILARKGEVLAVANLATGELVDRAGSKWNRFTNPQLTDELNVPIVPVAYRLAPDGDGLAASRGYLVRPSLARGAFKTALEEGEKLWLKPLMHLNTSAEVHEVWHTTKRDPGYLD